MGEQLRLESAALEMNKSKFREGFKQSPCDVFNYSLKKLFIFNEQGNTDKW